MIADTFGQCRRYMGLSPRFAAAFDFLENQSADKPNGRYDIDGDDCFALVQTYQTRPQEQALFETHRRYIDIQWLQAGCETMFWTPRAAFTEVTQPYAAEKDVIFYAAPAHRTPISLRAGEFVIFFPEDGHAGGLECGGPVEVRKVVIKVRA